MATLQERIERGDVLIMDGAMGTELQRRRVPMDSAAWSGVANLTHPEVVRQVHEDYLRAGAEIHITNTFSAARHVLQAVGRKSEVRSANEQAVAQFKEACDRVAPTQDVWLAGSISSFVPRNDRPRQITVEQLRESHEEQAAILAASGVDVLVLEMMKQSEHTLIALDAARTTGLPVWVGFSCVVERDPTPQVRMRDVSEPETLATMLDQVLPEQPDGVFIMHTDVRDTSTAFRVLRARWNGFSGAYPHSGVFKMPDWQFEDIVPVSEFVQVAESWVDEGAQSVGTCCGMGPDYIRALCEWRDARQV